jgi:hypothetical protein
VAIALAQIEKMGIAAPRIFVRRLLMEPGSAVLKAIAGGKNAKSNKRKIDDSTVGEEADTTVSKNTSKKGRQYEYANCNLILEGVRRIFDAFTPSHLKSYIARILIHAITLTSCDFTRGLSYFNANVLLTNKNLLWSGLCKSASVNTETGIVSLCPRMVAENVVGKFYKEVLFPKQCSSGSMKNANFETLYGFLSTTETISKGRRDHVISPGHLCCLVKSGNWVNFYWTDPQVCPCSVLSGVDYGFKQDKPNGKVDFDDKKPLPALQSKM